jgi:hypothetical protein
MTSRGLGDPFGGLRVRMAVALINTQYSVHTKKSRLSTRHLLTCSADL